MVACADGTLAEQRVEWAKEAAVCVVMALGGYPKAYNKGDAITGLDEAKAAGARCSMPVLHKETGRL